MTIQFPKIKSSYYALEGGLDLMTPAISLPPGRSFDCLNYEPEISGGYRRIDGYERFDGQPSPTDTSTYTTVKCFLTQDIPIDYGVNGATSLVSGRLVGIDSTNPDHHLLILSGVDPSTQTYVANEKLVTHEGVEAGFTVAESSEANDPEDDADYKLLAVNDKRRDIDTVPGSGRIRGVFVLNDLVHAFRDNEAGTAQNLYRESETGWEQIIYGKEIQFNSGSVPVVAGDIITNGSGTAQAVVGVVVLRSGSWTAEAGDQARGTIVIQFGTLTGNWIEGDTIVCAGVTRAVAATPCTDITRLPGGDVEMVKHTFGARTGNQVIYGVDGVNLAFEFNGPTFVPIRTGMTSDTPDHVAAHLNYLFLSFGSSIQFSAVNNPYAWTVLLGAGEFSAGDQVTGMLPMTGSNQAPVMAVFTQSKVSMLYGLSAGGSQPFRLQNAVTEIGYSAGTIQPISGTAFGLTARGLQTLGATEQFGDFAFSSISSLVQPLINRLRGQESCSVVLKNKNQYRVYYGDDNGTCMVVGLTGEKVTGIMPLEYGRPVRCIWTETFTDGLERTFFGSDDGYVYEDNKGTSFDGEPIEAWLRLVFNHEKSPQLRKRWRRAVLEARVDGFCKVNFSFDLGYGNPDVAPPPAVVDSPLVGGVGGYWDQFIWDQFHWDSRTVITPSIRIEGTEKNISLIFYSNRAQDASHTLQGVSLQYTDRRSER